MKQVTGKTNSVASIDKVSIRLALDGHSFSVVGLAEASESALVEILTPRTILVPAELMKEGEKNTENMAELLAVAGLPLASGEYVVCSSDVNGIVAIMAVPQAAIQQVEEHIRHSRYTTPLLEIEAEGTTLRIHQTSVLLYIKVYDESRLQMAEVIPAAEENDLLYFIERLEEIFPLKKYRAIISGDETKRMRKVIGRKVKEVICE